MLSLRAQYGFIIAHRPTVMHLQKDHVKGLELEYVIPTNGCDDWQQPFLLPSYSFAYQYLDLGNRAVIGSGHALTGRMIFPLNKNKIVQTYISSGFGIGYIEKPYDRFENYKNVAIGSHINAVVSFSFRAAISTGRYSHLDAGISFTHFSNGSFRTPNLGINVPALQMGYSRYLGNALPCRHYEIPPAAKQHLHKITAAAGAKTVESATGPLTYGVTSLEASRIYIISHKSRMGGGVDLFYDRTLPWKLNGLHHEGLKKNVAFRAGIHAGYELTPGKWTLLFQNGFYIYDEYDEDGFIYTKVGAEYSLTDKFFICFNLKSHFAKADYFEYGIGMKL
jgi:hypothetical protein